MTITVTFKQIGQNLNLTIDGQAFSKRIIDKVERDSIIALVKDLVAKPTETKKNKLIKLFTANTVKAKVEEEKAVVAKKSVEKKIKKVEAKSPKVVKEKPINEIVKDADLKDKIEKLERENAELKAKLAPVPVASTGRRGEY